MRRDELGPVAGCPLDALKLHKRLSTFNSHACGIRKG